MSLSHSKYVQPDETETETEIHVAFEAHHSRMSSFAGEVWNLAVTSEVIGVVMVLALPLFLGLLLLSDSASRNVHEMMVYWAKTFDHLAHFPDVLFHVGYEFQWAPAVTVFGQQNC